MPKALGDIVVVNDNKVFDKPGDVTVYRSRESACFNMEALDLNGGNIHALSGDGRLLKLEADGGRVRISDSGDSQKHVGKLRSWLVHAARHSGKTRSSTPGVSHSIDATIEDLLGLIDIR